MQVTIRRFPCARVRAFVHVERVFEAACGIEDDLVEPVLLAEVCQREAVCPHLGVRLENGNYLTLRLYFVQQWRRMRDQQFINRDSFLLKRLNGSFYINRIPECYRRRM